MNERAYIKPPWAARTIGARMAARFNPSVSRLSVQGRSTGRWHTVSVALLEHEGQRYLLAAGGETDWSRNLRTARSPIQRTTRRSASPRPDGRDRSVVVTTCTAGRRLPPPVQTAERVDGSRHEPLGEAVDCDAPGTGRRLTAVVVAGGDRVVRTVDDVVDRMRAIESDLPRRDGVAEFNRVYLQVTELVRDRLRDGFFRDTRFMERFGVVFAGLYFDSVDAAAAGTDVARPWAPLVEARRRRGVEPVQFVLAGMNAHINHDLAVAVVATCSRARREPDTVHDDYERVNELLASVVRPIRQSFLDAHVVEAGAPLSPLADVVSAWSIDTARDAAWVHARTLWEIRRARALTQAYRGALARTVGLVGRQLLVAYGAPTGPGTAVASRRPRS